MDDWKLIGEGTPEGAIRYAVPEDVARTIQLGQRVALCAVTAIDRLRPSVDVLPLKAFRSQFDTNRTAWFEDCFGTPGPYFEPNPALSPRNQG